MRTRAKLLAFFVTISTACSLLTPLDDLAGGEAGTFDASDATKQNDTGVEGAASDASDAAPFCATLDAASVLFCDDFDQTDAAFFPNWTTGGLTTPTRDGVVFLSPPFAVLATSPATDGGTSEDGYLQRSFANVGTHVVYSFDVRVGAADGQGREALINSITVYGGPNATTQYRIGVTQSVTRFSVSAVVDGGSLGGSSFPFSSAWLPGSWHHVVMDLQVAAIPATATVTVDGKIEVGPDAPASVATLGANGKILFKVGIYSAASPQSGWAFDIDNAVAQMQ